MRGGGGVNPGGGTVPTRNIFRQTMTFLQNSYAPALVLALVTTYHNTCKSQLYDPGDENLLTVTLCSCSVSIVNAGAHPHEAGMLRGPT